MHRSHRSETDTYIHELRVHNNNNNNIYRMKIQKLLNYPVGISYTGCMLCIFLGGLTGDILIDVKFVLLK